MNCRHQSVDRHRLYLNTIKPTQFCAGELEVTILSWSPAAMFYPSALGTEAMRTLIFVSDHINYIYFATLWSQMRGCCLIASG